MGLLVDNVSVEYGDTKISIFGIKTQDNLDLSPIWHKHNYYELHFCNDRFRDYKFNDKNVRFKQGQLMIIPPDTNHNTTATIDPMPQPPLALIFTVTKIKSKIHFYDKIIQALEENSLTPLTIHGISIDDIALFHKNLSLYGSLLGLCELKASASNIMYKLFKSILNDITFRTDNNESILVLLDNLVNDPKYTLSDIAKATNYSQRHLSRIIKQHYGLNFSELRSKIKEANK